jgi:hypothetical protein
VILAVLAVALPGLMWTGGPDSASAVQAAGVKRIFVPAEQAGAWAGKGFDVHDVKELDAYTKVPAPSTQRRTNFASATEAPWINANGWRYRRGTDRAFYDKLPAGTAAIAAAESHAYGVDAVLAAEAADLPALGQMLKFLGTVKDVKLPVMANIGVIDDGSPVVGEVLNLLARRNLSYVVEKSENSKLDLNVQVGSKDFPKEAAANPNDFAARVREKLTDDRRVFRIFGSYTVIGHLTGDKSRARLYLLNYARRPTGDIHIRVLGSYKKIAIADSAQGDMKPADFRQHQGGTEFSIPSIQTYSIIDLER